MGTLISYSKGVISSLDTCHMMKKECLYYLAQIYDQMKYLSLSKTTGVVREFIDVFSIDLEGVHPHIDINFLIDWVLVTKPASIHSYWMSLKELNKLKER